MKAFSGVRGTQKEWVTSRLRYIEEFFGFMGDLFEANKERTVESVESYLKASLAFVSGEDKDFDTDVFKLLSQLNSLFVKSFLLLF